MKSSSHIDRAYNYIREQIEGGIVRPGQRLSRRMLAEEIAVSAAVILKAFAQLEREGILETRSRSGTYVRELLAEDWSDLCDLREMLEPYAAARAAERISEEQIQILRASCQRYHQFPAVFPLPGNATAAWLQHCQIDQEERLFHGTILQAAGNKLLGQVIPTLRLLSNVSPQLIYADGYWRENNLTVVAYEHTGIMEAIAVRDSELAKERMLNHLRGARAVLLKDSAPVKS
ncbi:MAG TPA: GntR family transcriptional regulator [Planctomicrobium sp.]|nr:GntR family transcriptional regulator [Planctomicrobium sp.]